MLGKGEWRDKAAPPGVLLALYLQPSFALCNGTQLGLLPRGVRVPLWYPVASQAAAASAEHFCTFFLRKRDEEKNLLNIQIFI